MKLVVGLGNHGKEYEHNRHNVGFMIIDRIVKDLRVSPHVEKKLDALVFYHHSSKTILARPQTFMNDSGKAVSRLANYYKVKPSVLWVIHDDLDIKLGQYKIQKGKGPKVHRGIKSVNEALGTRDYWRVRVGVENRLRQIQNPKSKTQKISGERYVLQNFTDKELEILKPVIDKIVKELTEYAKS